MAFQTAKEKGAGRKESRFLKRNAQNMIKKYVLKRLPNQTLPCMKTCPETSSTLSVFFYLDPKDPKC